MFTWRLPVNGNYIVYATGTGSVRERWSIAVKLRVACARFRVVGLRVCGLLICARRRTFQLTHNNNQNFRLDFQLNLWVSVVLVMVVPNTRYDQRNDAFAQQEELRTPTKLK